MTLPISPPIAPALARSAAELPAGEDWLFERKWDGFRTIVFVDGDDVFVQSRNGKPMSRYFPELEFPRGRYVLDGELVIRDDSGDELFETLQGRIHPAESRVKMLSQETPATFIAFDLLADGDESLLALPFAERRERLETAAPEGIELTPLGDRDAAEGWLQTAEGAMAKKPAALYIPGKRDGMTKIKRVRTIDTVVMGWRPGKHEGTVGSLILGLYDTDGELRTIGHTSAFSAKRARELVDELAPYESGEHGSAAPSRWSADRDLEWRSLRPELVVEVSFDHRSGHRIRHGAKLLRFREDRDPGSCEISQLES